MGKQVAQGTRLESRIRTDAIQHGRKAQRTARTGRKHEADVLIAGSGKTLPAVVWQHMRPSNGGNKRVSTTMVVMDYQDWLSLLDSDQEAEFGWAIQAKSTQRLAVSTIFRGLKDWLKEHGT